MLHPVSITRFPLSRFSPGAGLLRNPFVYTINAKIFQGLGPKRRGSCNGDRVYFINMSFITGFQAGSGQTGFSQKGHESTHFAIFVKVRTCCHISPHFATCCHIRCVRNRTKRTTATMDSLRGSSVKHWNAREY